MHPSSQYQPSVRPGGKRGSPVLVALLAALALTTIAPGAAASDRPAGVLYDGHLVVPVPFTAAQLLRAPRTVVGLLDGRSILAGRVGHLLAVSLPAAAAPSAGRYGWRQRMCVWAVTAVILAIGVAGITALLIAAGPEATEISLAGRLISREVLKELRILLTTGSSIAGFIAGRVCK